MLGTLRGGRSSDTTGDADRYTGATRGLLIKSTRATRGDTGGCWENRGSYSGDTPFVSPTPSMHGGCSHHPPSSLHHPRYSGWGREAPAMQQRLTRGLRDRYSADTAQAQSDRGPRRPLEPQPEPTSLWTYSEVTPSILRGYLELTQAIGAGRGVGKPMGAHPAPTQSLLRGYREQGVGILNEELSCEYTQVTPRLLTGYSEATQSLFRSYTEWELLNGELSREHTQVTLRLLRDRSQVTWSLLRG